MAPPALFFAISARGSLYRMKKDTVRLQDRAGAERLRQDFGLEGAGVSVERYRSGEEMPVPAAPSKEELYRRIARVWRMGRLLAGRRYPHAVLTPCSSSAASRKLRPRAGGGSARTVRTGGPEPPGSPRGHGVS